MAGGTGFIGGHDVTVLDNLELSDAEGIKRHTLRVHQEVAGGRAVDYQFVEGDVRDPETVHGFVADADVVVHQAAQASVRTSVAEPRKVTDSNVGGMVTLLEAAKEADVDRVILASSPSVYGKPESLPYAEEHPTEPVSRTG